MEKTPKEFFIRFKLLGPAFERMPVGIPQCPDYRCRSVPVLDIQLHDFFTFFITVHADTSTSVWSRFSSAPPFGTLYLTIYKILLRF